MKSKRTIVVVMMLMMLGGIICPGLTSCKSNKQPVAECCENDSVAYEDLTSGDDNDYYDDEDSVINEYHWEPTVIPSFVKRLIPDGDWSADTICVVGGKAYYVAYDGRYRMNVVYSEDGILAKDPTLGVLPYDKERNLFHVSVVGKDMLVDFSDRNSRQQMSSLTVNLPEFTPFYHEATADYCDRVSYSIAIDFPKRTVAYSDAITQWLIRKIEDSEDTQGDLPPLNAFYIGYAKRTNAGWHYDGDIHNHKRVCKFASDVYFAIVKSEYGMSEVDYPSSLFSTLCLKAYVKNSRFVTYQQYTHGYYGGAHGYYTERLLSYDYVHRQEIDYKYLFKDGSMEDILALLIEEAKKSPNYQIWKPNIEDFTCVKDENDEPTGLKRLPHPRLSKEGVVFSFQPYEISCFAAGTFHFTIPYERLRPFLTDKAKWCLNMN